MSDQVLAVLFTLAVFVLLAAWVPLLDFLQRRWQAQSSKQVHSQAFALKQTHQAKR